MKTLVIHPADRTTDFLKTIYENQLEWTIVNSELSRNEMKDVIKKHDRIIMLGHGDENGLYGFDHYVINDSVAYSLKTKFCICIWCKTYNFVMNNDLKGFFTGMIVSDEAEAFMYKLNATAAEIEESNDLFAKAIRDNLSSSTIVDDVLKSYDSETNEIIQFNRKNLFYRQ